MFSQRTLILIFSTLTALGLSACASPVAITNPFNPEPTLTPTETVTPPPPTNTPEPLALTVNGEGVSLVEFNADVADYTRAQEALGKTVASADATDAVIQDLSAQLLLAQGARTNGFNIGDEGVQQRIDSLLAQIGGADNLSKWQSDHGYSDPTFRSALRRAAEAAWMRDKIIAEVPSTAEQVHIQQILLYNQGTAEKFLSQLNAGAEFDELALQADPLTRGELGWIPRGYLLDKKIEEAAFLLPVGGHSEVIATDVGFHIIKVLAHETHPLSPDAYLALQELALKNWIDEQRKQATIVLAPS